MKAQALYDLRQLTGFCSGTDLHDFFQRVVGDPSPSGDAEIEAVGLDAINLFASRKLAADAMRQYGVNDEAIAVFLAADNTVDALRSACEIDYEIEMSK